MKKLNHSMPILYNTDDIFSTIRIKSVNYFPWILNLQEWFSWSDESALAHLFPWDKHMPWYTKEVNTHISVGEHLPHFCKKITTRTFCRSLKTRPSKCTVAVIWHLSCYDRVEETQTSVSVVKIIVIFSPHLFDISSCIIC